MSVTIIVGVDGSSASERSIAHAKDLAKLMTDCHIQLVYVIEWSPYTFQTAEENANRHKRREEEIDLATSRVVNPSVDALTAEGFSASGVVRHGDAAEILNSVAVKASASQIVVARAADKNIMSRIFGTVTAKLVMSADVPVTVVP